MIDPKIPQLPKCKPLWGDSKHTSSKPKEMMHRLAPDGILCLVSEAEVPQFTSFRTAA